MVRVPRKVNLNKLVMEAEATKSKVKKSKIEAYLKWQKKLGRKSSKLDQIDANLRACLKKIEAESSAKEKNVKALADLLKMINEAHKELKEYQQIPAGPSLPPPPKNVTAVQSLVVVVTALLAYIAAVKVYMAMAQALSKKDKSDG